MRPTGLPPFKGTPMPPLVRGMQSTQESQKGCALLASIFITVVFIIPWMIYSRAKHDVQETVMARHMVEGNVEFVVLYEENWAGPTCKVGDKIACADGADLCSVNEKLPLPWSTPRYVWRYKGIPPTLVFGVFNSMDAAKAWMKREGYTGDDVPFKLDFLKRDDRQRSGECIARVDVPRWSKDVGRPVRQQMDVAVFTDQYNIWDGEVFNRTDPEIYNVYRQLPRED